MEITEVRVSLKDGGNKKLKAYATVTFDDCFVVRNIKVIEGGTGLFVAMPSKKSKQFCPRCGKKVEVKSKHCNQCGAQLPPAPVDIDKEQSQQMYQDIAHPINQQFRDYLQKKVLDEYNKQKGQAGSENADGNSQEKEISYQSDQFSDNS